MDGVASHPPFTCSFVHNTIGVGLSLLASHLPIVQYSKVPVATHSATSHGIFLNQQLRRQSVATILLSLTLEAMEIKRSTESIQFTCF